MAIDSKFKNGFYTELDELKKEDAEASFGFLQNIMYEEDESFTAYDFLHGWCSHFAMVLSSFYGYKIETVRRKIDGEAGKLIHAYCTVEIDGQKAYIDIRGITTDAELFFAEFKGEATYYNGEICSDYIDSEYDVAVDSYNSTEQYIAEAYDECEYDTEAEFFINNYRDYYDIRKV